MTKKMKILKKIFKKIFFDQNRFRINQKAFLVKIPVLKFFQKMVKNGQKWPKMVKNGQKWTFLKKKFRNFVFKSIQNVLKRILNRKSWFRKIFPLIFFLGLNHFLTKMVKKWKFSKKIFKKNFFEIDSECSKTYFKPKKLVSKKITPWFFSGT